MMKSHFLKQGILKIIVFTIVAVFSFSSCENDDTNNSEPVINDNYYVQYIITGNGTYGRFSNWTATTPQGLYSNSGYQVKNWDQTYGPVNKGFKCEVLIEDYISGPPTIEIRVSKNDEPFSLKVIETGDSATYTIDF